MHRAPDAPSAWAATITEARFDGRQKLAPRQHSQRTTVLKVSCRTFSIVTRTALLGGPNCSTNDKWYYHK